MQTSKWASVRKATFQLALKQQHCLFLSRSFNLSRNLNYIIVESETLDKLSEPPTNVGILNELYTKVRDYNVLTMVKEVLMT